MSPCCRAVVLTPWSLEFIQCLKIQFVPHIIHYFSNTKSSWLMVCMEIMVYLRNVGNVWAEYRAFRLLQEWYIQY